MSVRLCAGQARYVPDFDDETNDVKIMIRCGHTIDNPSGITESKART